MVLTPFASSGPRLFSFRFSLEQFVISVASQSYRVAVHEESVILGNDVLFKCNIQSYVADFVSVSSWVDSEGLSITVNQNYGNLPQTMLLSTYID